MGAFGKFFKAKWVHATWKTHVHPCTWKTHVVIHQPGRPMSINLEELLENVKTFFIENGKVDEGICRNVLKADSKCRTIANSKWLLVFNAGSVWSHGRYQTNDGPVIPQYSNDLRSLNDETWSIPLTLWHKTGLKVSSVTGPRSLHWYHLWNFFYSLRFETKWIEIGSSSICVFDLTRS